MGEVSLDTHDYAFNWDWLVTDNSDGFHLEARDLLETTEFSGAISPLKNLRTYDIDIHEALDGSHHQHLDEIIDDQPKRKKNREAQPTHKLKTTYPWSLKYNYIFLFLCNFLMLVVYYKSDLLEDVPRAVWFLILLVHISAIGLYAIDTTTHLLHKKGCCIPKQNHNV